MTTDHKPSRCVLFVDDETQAVKYFQEFFGSEFPILTATNIQDAQAIIQKRGQEIAIVVSDQKMPTGSGVELLSEVGRRFPEIIRVLTTAYASLDSSLLAINQGHIFAYVTKPWDIDNMRATLHSAYREFDKRQALLALAGSIAHEMRTPLGQAQFSLEQIERAMPSPAVYGQAQTVEIKNLDAMYSHIAQGKSALVRGAQVIEMILNELSGKPLDPGRFEYLEAGASTQKIVDSYGFDSLDERDKVRVKVVNDFVLKVDETAYTFVLYNLLKNALYYFKLKPEASMTITVAAPTVTVHDTGPGMAPHALGQLFEAFSTSGKAEGTGLGLAYCKRAMRAFGGDITCESVEGAFTEFTLHFPVVTAAEVQAHERVVLQSSREAAAKQAREHIHVEAMTPDVFARRTIVIADDDKMSRRMVMSYLRPWGMTFLEAQNGLEVMALLESGVSVDAVLMEMEMPGMDGLEATRWMRGHPNYRDIAVIALTANFGEADIQKTKEAGMNGFLSKPASVESLREKLLAVWAGKEAWPAFSFE